MNIRTYKTLLLAFAVSVNVAWAQEGAPVVDAAEPAATTKAITTEAPPAEAAPAQVSPAQSAPVAPKPDPTVVHQITLTTPLGTTLDAYVAGPEDAPFGILLLHDYWGLNDSMRQWVQRYAAKGYRALAIDVFDGRKTGKQWLAQEIMGAIDPEWVRYDVLAGLKYLKAPNRKVATMGWGYGGWQSFQAALIAPNEVSATVIWYGPLDETEEAVRRLRAPVLGIYAKDDSIVPPPKVAGYERLMRRSLVRYSASNYAGQHGFADPQYPGYNPALAGDAWKEVDQFLETYIERGGAESGG
jgi:carboxymethylenebutenolidase